MYEVLDEQRIPYDALGRDLSDPETGEQRLIPFLGAGASLGPRDQKSWTTSYPSAAAVEGALDSLGVPPDSRARDIGRLGLLLASYLAGAEAAGGLPSSPRLTDLKSDAFSPSVSRLARSLAMESRYTGLREVAESLHTTLESAGEALPDNQRIFEALDSLIRATSVADPPDALSSISSLLVSRTGRERLWLDLQNVFSVKRTPRPIHQLLAGIAHTHLSRPGALDYLIITTNYDTLMEQALDAAGVPHVVLMTTLKDRRVLTRFSSLVPDARGLEQRNNNQYPKHFALLRPTSLAVLYKMHGCLNGSLTTDQDGVVISDDDYVAYLSNIETSEGMVPAYVNTLTRKKSFVFLGYSLKDWNVRIMFEAVRRSRQYPENTRDYSVVNWFGEYETAFLNRNQIVVLRTDLSKFAESIDGARSPKS